MIKKGKLFLTALCFLSLTAGLAACGKDAKLPDVSSLGEAVVISREDGSGTRSEFESLIDTYGIGTDQIASSTDEVTSLVASANNAIGYLAYSSASEAAGVKLLTVNGVAVSEETIRNKSYPLCRSYYLAYSGDLSDAENDFLTYVLSKGQDTVSTFAVPVKDSATFLSDKSSGSIEIAGSSSAAPILAALAEEYQTLNPNVQIHITVTDSTQGLTAAMHGECDIAMSSRELKEYENELLTKTAIARDGIAVIVNTQNPVTDLSVKQIKKLYDKACENWQDLNK